MRLVFMGTPEFAVPSLEAIATAHQVLVVYTRPDRPRGRGREDVPSPVKSHAIERGIPVRQPTTLRSIEEVAFLRSLSPDAIVVAAYGAILPAEILEIPAHGCINVHASLLPRHRGAAPIHHAVLDGDTETGVSIMLMEEGLDTGPYATVVRTPTDTKTVTELESELAVLGAEALLDTLSEIEAGTVVWTPQNDDAATYATKITADDVRLEPSLSVSDAVRRVRASTRSARAKVDIDGCVMDVLDAVPASERVAPGMVVAYKTELVIGFADGSITAREVRPQGRQPMQGCAWARGARVGQQATWEPA